MSQNDNLIQVKYMFPNFKSDVYECQTQINLTFEQINHQIIIPYLQKQKFIKNQPQQVRFFHQGKELQLNNQIQSCKSNSVSDILFIHVHILQGVDPILLARDKAIGAQEEEQRKRNCLDCQIF